MDTILQWNCRGLRANYNELSLLIAKYHPIAVCLQETNIPASYTNTLRFYTLFHTSSVRTDGQLCGGVAILVRSDVPPLLGIYDVKLATNCRSYYLA